MHVGDNDAWLGGEDSSNEDAWVWSAGGDQFWEGKSGGQATCADGTTCSSDARCCTLPDGLFSQWGSGLPDASLFTQQDCLEHRGASDDWNDADCGDQQGYICESLN